MRGAANDCVAVLSFLAQRKQEDTRGAGAFGGMLLQDLGGGDDDEDGGALRKKKKTKSGEPEEVQPQSAALSVAPQAHAQQEWMESDSIDFEQYM